MMDITENLINACAQLFVETISLRIKGRSQSAKPFRRLTMIEAVKEYTGVDFDAFVGDNEKAHAVAKELNLPVEKHHVWGDILNLAFEEK